MRCLEKQAARRFQTMAGLKSALQQVSSQPADKQPSIAVLPVTDRVRERITSTSATVWPKKLSTHWSTYRG